MKESLEKQIYDAWHPSKFSTRYDLYDTINKVSRLKGYWDKEEPIKLSPLNIEIAMNNRAEVLNLIRTGANVNKVNEAGFTPLIEALLLNNYEISKLLLENGANVNGTENFIPLIIAGENHNDLMIELLLNYGADATICDKYGFNTLHHMFIDRKVCNLKSQIPYVMNNQLSFASNLYRRPDMERTINCINLLVEYGLDVNYSPETNIYFSLENPETIKLNPLSLVLENTNEEVLKRLIELGAERRVIELNSSNIYAYQDSFAFIQDIKDGDISSWIDAPIEYVRYLDYLKKIKKYNIEVYNGSLNDGYKRPKLIKKY